MKSNENNQIKEENLIESDSSINGNKIIIEQKEKQNNIEQNEKQKINNKGIKKDSEEENKEEMNKNSINIIEKEILEINNNSNNNNVMLKQNENSKIDDKKLINDINKKNKIINITPKYLTEIKKYLNNEELINEYNNIIKNEPEKLFEIISDRTIMYWQSVVYNFETTIIDSDCDILTVAPERKDQQVIINDSNRTRFKESDLVPGFKKILEEILTFYCNTKEIEYKQGLNEIFGPLILMRYKLKQLKYSTIFNIGEAFIDRFLPDYFYEKELYSLRSSISLFTHLLKYHEPCIYNYLDSIEILHELYAANWLLTLRAQKLNLDILYSFWDNLIKINDPLFIHFILVALIKYKRELLINCDSNLLLKLMVALTFNSKEELEEIIKIALELRSNTPYSFRLLANRIGFLKINNRNVKKNFDKYKPESSQLLQILPIELLYTNYPNKVECPDPDCNNNINNKSIENLGFTDFDSKNKINNIHSCEKCDMKIKKKMNYIILDLRLFPPNYFKEDDDYFKMGFVSGMMTIDKEELKLDNIDSLLSSRLLSIRGTSHIILMTSKTDYFYDFEQKYYSDDRSELMKKKILFGVIEPQKEEKKLNLEDAEKSLDLKEIYKLKEYDNFRKIMISMKKNNFPYVSYLEGGFEALHRESLCYNIELVNHNKKECKLCKKIKKEKQYKKSNTEEQISNISNTLWNNIKVITKKELNKFFTNEDNIVLVCSLIRYKNKYFHKNEIEVFIVFLFDKKSIEIYKNDFRKDNSNNNYNIDNINYYNLGLKKEQKEDFKLRLFENIQFDNVETINTNKKQKNTSFLKIKNKENEKNKIKFDNSYEIGFEFYSMEDSKAFKKAIKKLLINTENIKIFS